MEKQYYDHRTKLCAGCAYYHPEGMRDGHIDPSAVWPESCELYGYSFNTKRFPEDADSCKGFKTPAQRAREESLKKRK